MEVRSEMNIVNDTLSRYEDTGEWQTIHSQIADEKWQDFKNIRNKEWLQSSATNPQLQQSNHRVRIIEDTDNDSDLPMDCPTTWTNRIRNNQHDNQNDNQLNSSSEPLYISPLASPSLITSITNQNKSDNTLLTIRDYPHTIDPLQNYKYYQKHCRKVRCKNSHIRQKNKVQKNKHIQKNKIKQSTSKITETKKNKLPKTIKNLQNNKNKKLGVKVKRRKNFKSTLERNNCNYFRLKPSQIPKNEVVTLRIGATDPNKQVFNLTTLLDTGSTMSSISRDKALKIAELTGAIIESRGDFVVENGGNEEEVYTGDYISLNVQVVNTTIFRRIPFFITPTDGCYSVII